MNFNKAEFLTSYGNLSQIPESEKLEIAFSGRSNVGKSSLINKIFNRKSLARVSSMPGKTVTINFYSLEDIYLADLPGYGYAKVAKTEKTRWADLIEGYLQADRNLALIFQLIDMRHTPTDDDIHMLNFLVDNEIPFVIILTKADKLSNTQRRERLENLKNELDFLDDVKIIEFSSVNGDGVEAIRNIIEDISKTDEIE
ncbi:MAG: ribosome biogenesis GTP-binding protein YihA/YsxC [Oscillospiraceae bacterium]